MESRYSTEKEKTLKAPTWDLESIFPGGSNSSKYTSFRESIRNDMKRSVVKFSHLPQKLNDSNRPKWIDYIVKLQELMARIVEADDFVHCLVSQNVADEKAIQIYGEIDIFRSEFQKLLVSLEAFAKKQSNKEWGKLVASKRLGDAAFFLNELREIAKIKMAPEFESFAADLAVNGYHAWNRLYDKIYGDMRIDFHENGETKKLSPMLPQWL
ncbi:MAG: hypothetical protein NTV06_03320 [candidate division Zixibacteria bacterium]|nr:hypothetical protein [candidate division Zixibacteria bacterium]